MGLKNDAWIRRMALEHKMIEPFAEKQVRQGVISFGVSSYGYDMRIADEFLIFTNVFGALVDPKAFDERAFVKQTGDFCVIPPNSFALGRSVEYFRIPRDVLCIVLGKSSYARCFTADTRVPLSNGREMPLAQMVDEASSGIEHYVYTLLPTGRVGIARAVKPRRFGRERVIRVILDNKETIRCTPDHYFLRRDGSWVQARSLKPGDSLMPLDTRISSRRLMEGWEEICDPSSMTYLLSQCRNHNHKVVAVEDRCEIEDVYCLSVPESGNFGLAAGVFVHNCGIIVNVTPLEPGWMGNVTVEISNTTPLPAKIYAGEGIAQVVFIEADEPCEVSYADRKGKYQDQRGIVLPKVG